jgi:hypothetical protein
LAPSAQQRHFLCGDSPEGCLLSVDPRLAALWFLSAIALAGLLVYAWRRLMRPVIESRQGLCANAMRRCLWLNQSSKLSEITKVRP